MVCGAQGYLYNLGIVNVSGPVAQWAKRWPGKPVTFVRFWI